jgi:hypothetical protein
MNTALTFAAQTGLFDTAIGGIIKALMAAGALIILIIGVMKAVSAFTSGQPGKGAKTIIGTAVVCVFLFRPELLSQLIAFMSTIVEAVIGSGNDIVDGAKNTTPTTVPPVK